ncbi:MAG: hypothetical protein ACLU5J_05405 [Christensenellales bacterium]
MLTGNLNNSRLDAVDTNLTDSSNVKPTDNSHIWTIEIENGIYYLKASNGKVY